jgi:putative ABC transport system permease protein
MTRRVPLARRTLFEDRRRAVLAIGGVAAGLVVVLIMNGVFAGMTRQETAYLDSLPADLVVSQAGVTTMQMSVSTLPPEVEAGIKPLPGVAWVTPLRQTSATIAAGNATPLVSYLFGLPAGDQHADPHPLSAGRLPGPGEIVVDAIGAGQLGVGIGDHVDVFGKTFRISGLTDGLTGIANTTAFITADDFSGLAGPGTNYLLVGKTPDVSAAELAARVEHAVPNATVQTGAAFSHEEAQFIADIYGDVLHTMIVIGLLTAMALVALTLSVVTRSNARGYAILRALGATPGRLTSVVAAQAVLAVITATIVATAIALALSATVAVLSPNIEVRIEPAAVLTTLIAALVVGAPAALLPLRRVLRLDPAAAFNS